VTPLHMWTTAANQHEKCSALQPNTAMQLDL